MLVSKQATDLISKNFLILWHLPVYSNVWFEEWRENEEKGRNTHTHVYENDWIISYFDWIWDRSVRDDVPSSFVLTGSVLTG